MNTIYIVEDDQNIREIESFALKNSGYHVQGYETASDFFHGIAAKIPDLIILDIMLPDEDGLSILKKLRKRPDTRRVPVMMITAKQEEIDKVKGFDLGADDYMAKPFGVMEMIARVKALLRRSQGGGEEKILSLGPVVLDGEKRQAIVNGHLVDLTFKEYELLQFLLRNQGIVLSRDQIMDRVWDGYEGESRTLDMHIKSLRQKLGSASSMIRTIRNVGYMAEWEDSMAREME
ncbi:MAG: response regulator transcription factor [Clostridiales bacterium]|nr:response regulator transcription factor [Clostridiales bacterium]